MGTTTSVKLDDDARRDLDELARAGDRTVHYLIRKAVREFIDREKARRALLADSLAAAAHRDESGGGKTLAQARKHFQKKGKGSRTA